MRSLVAEVVEFSPFVAEVARLWWEDPARRLLPPPPTISADHQCRPFEMFAEKGKEGKPLMNTNRR